MTALPLSGSVFQWTAKDAERLREAGKAIRAEIRRQDRAAKRGETIDRGFHLKEDA